jgi:hypothetical protein
MTQPRPMRAHAGIAAVELALILPLLVLIVLMVIDLARAIQTQIILINISREGASLASLSPAFQGQPQKIMDALVASTPPLYMNDPAHPKEYGMIYITEVTAYQQMLPGNPPVPGPIRNVVTGQYRWTHGSGTYLPASSVWQCPGGSWAGDGHCSAVPATAGADSPTGNVMTGKLAPGDVVYAAEVFYHFDAWFKLITLSSLITTPDIGPDLRAMTVL